MVAPCRTRLPFLPRLSLFASQNRPLMFRFTFTLLLTLALTRLSGQGQVLLTADFEGGTLPPGWTRSQAAGSTGWQVGDSASLSGTFWRIPARGGFAASNDDRCECDMSADYLIAPALDTRSLPALFLRFAAYYDGIFGSQARVVARTGPEAPWQPVFSLPPTGTWTSHTLDLRAWTGRPYVQLAFHHNDGGGWGTGVAVDAVSLSVPPARDLALSTSGLPAFLRPGFLDLSFSLTHQGTEVITSYQLGWQVDQNPPQVAHFGAGRLAPLADTTHVHPIPWLASQPGPHTLRLWVAQPNGTPDENPADDTLTFALTVIAGAPERPILVEAFTQHNCQTCAQQNPGLHDLLYALRDRVAPVTYHAPWPLGNNDPMHLFNAPAHLSRLDFYQIGGVPYGLLEGQPITGGSYTGAPDGLSASAVLTQAQRQPGLYRLDLASAPANGLIEVEVTVEALHTPPGPDPRLYVALVQDEVRFAQPPGVNGETEFPHVLRHFLPNPDGISLAGLSQPQTFTVAWSPEPALTGALHHIVAWVQDASSRAVWGVARSGGTYLCPGGGSLSLEADISPASCDGSGGAVALSLSGGQAPYQVTWSDSTVALSRSDLAAGWYPLQVQDASGCAFTTDLRVPARPGPELRPLVTPVSCPGGDDGAISLVSATPPAGYQYAWDHGPAQASLTGLTAGTYRATVTAPDGCTSTVEAVVPAPAPLVPTYRRDPDDGTGSGAVTVLPLGGTAPYTFTWNDGSSGPTRTGLTSGAFSYSVTDYYGCTYGPFTEYIWATALEAEEFWDEWRIYPQPARDQVEVRLQLRQPESLSYTLYDAQGRVLRQGNQPRQAAHQWTLARAGLPAGAYWLQVQTAQQSRGQWVIFLP